MCENGKSSNNIDLCSTAHQILAADGGIDRGPLGADRISLADGRPLPVYPINGHFQNPRRVSKVSKRPPLVALEMCGRLQ